MSRQHEPAPESVVRSRYHGIPAWILIRYLVELGGRDEERRPNSDRIVVGDGWRARVSELADREVGSIRLASVDVELAGEPAAVERLAEALTVRTRRGGG